VLHQHPAREGYSTGEELKIGRVPHGAHAEVLIRNLEERLDWAEASAIDPDNREIRSEYALSLLANNTAESVLLAFHVSPYFKDENGATGDENEIQFLSLLKKWIANSRGRRSGKELEETAAKLLQNGVSGAARKQLEKARQEAYIGINEPDYGTGGCFVTFPAIFLLGIFADASVDISGWLVWPPTIVLGILAGGWVGTFLDPAAISRRRSQSNARNERGD
jgi:hypothetical protein